MLDFITKEEFAAYLNSLPADHKFVHESGKAWSQCCPLAKCLQAHGYPNACVSPRGWHADNVPSSMPPEWARQYTRDLDWLCGTKLHTLFFTVAPLKYAKQALELL